MRTHNQALKLADAFQQREPTYYMRLTQEFPPSVIVQLFRIGWRQIQRRADNTRKRGRHDEANTLQQVASFISRHEHYSYF